MPPQAVWAGEARIRGSNEFIRMSLLTAAMLGLQLVWGLETTYCMPYLLELGLSKANTSLVWVAGPLSGLIVAPVVGAFADKSTSRFGRRRPFMVAGTLAIVVCIYALAWAREIMDALVGDVPSAPLATIIWAVFCIYALDFAINVVQWSLRSLIVDSLPTSKQQSGSAWATRAAALGHLTGYLVGALDLKVVFGTAAKGGTQFKQMSNVSAFALVVSIGITCWAVSERVLVSPGPLGKGDGPIGIFVRIFGTAWRLPWKMQGICNIQFWAWIGWFPFNFYGSTWVGETYFHYEASDKIASSQDRAGDIGRIGSTAMIGLAAVTLIGSIALPWLVQSPEDDKPAWERGVPASLAPLEDRLKSKKMDLMTAWMLSLLVFGGAMIMAPVIPSTLLASILVTVIGFPMALTGWAPFAFMGVEINRLKTSEALMHRRDSVDLDNPYAEDTTDEGSLAGIYLGILNLYVAGPQFISSFMCMGVFLLVDGTPGAGKDKEQSPVAIGWCLAVGAVCAFIAAIVAVRHRSALRKDDRK